MKFEVVETNSTIKITEIFGEGTPNGYNGTIWKTGRGYSLTVPGIGLNLYVMDYIGNDDEKAIEISRKAINNKLVELMQLFEHKMIVESMQEDAEEVLAKFEVMIPVPETIN